MEALRYEVLECSGEWFKFPEGSIIDFWFNPSGLSSENKCYIGLHSENWGFFKECEVTITSFHIKVQFGNGTRFGNLVLIPTNKPMGPDPYD